MLGKLLVSAPLKSVNKCLFHSRNAVSGIVNLAQVTQILQPTHTLVNITQRILLKNKSCCVEEKTGGSTPWSCHFYSNRDDLLRTLLCCSDVPWIATQQPTAACILQEGLHLPAKDWCLGHKHAIQSAPPSCAALAMCASHSSSVNHTCIDQRCLFALSSPLFLQCFLFAVHVLWAQHQGWDLVCVCSVWHTVFVVRGHDERGRALDIVFFFPFLLPARVTCLQLLNVTSLSM